MTNVTMNIETARKAAAEKIEARMQEAREQAELKLLNNEKFQEAIVQQKLREQTTEKLKELNDLCAAVVTDIEVYSKTLRKARTWNPSKRYGLGNQIAELVGLLSGIQYSVREHNGPMLALTGLSADLIERTLNALGQLPYYSTNYNEVVMGSKANVTELQTCLSLLEYELGMSLDTSLVTEEVLERQYEIALAKAQAAAAEATVTSDMEFTIIR